MDFFTFSGTGVDGNRARQIAGGCSMPLLVKGKIVSGIGVGGNFMGLKWVKRQIVEKLGFEPFVGTLNLKMDEENSSKFQSYIKSREGVLIEPVEPTSSLELLGLVMQTPPGLKCLKPALEKVSWSAGQKTSSFYQRVRSGWNRIRGIAQMKESKMLPAFSYCDR